MAVVKEVQGKMLDYVILTANQVLNCDDPELLIKEQEEKREIFGLDDGHYLCHFFSSSFFDERTDHYTIDDAIQCLAIKEGYDMVQFSNGNIGFIAYYDNKVNGFEIIDREV